MAKRRPNVQESGGVFTRFVAFAMLITMIAGRLPRQLRQAFLGSVLFALHLLGMFNRKARLLLALLVTALLAFFMVPALASATTTPATNLASGTATRNCDTGKIDGTVVAANWVTRSGQPYNSIFYLLYNKVVIAGQGNDIMAKDGAATFPFSLAGGTIATTVNSVSLTLSTPSSGQKDFTVALTPCGTPPPVCQSNLSGLTGSAVYNKGTDITTYTASIPKPACADLSVLSDTYLVPASYHGGGFGAPGSTPQSYIPAGRATLVIAKGTTTITVTKKIGAPCGRYVQPDVYTGPRQDTVDSSGSNGYVAGGITETADCVASSPSSSPTKSVTPSPSVSPSHSATHSKSVSPSNSSGIGTGISSQIPLVPVSNNTAPPSAKADTGQTGIPAWIDIVCLLGLLCAAAFFVHRRRTA